MIEKRPLYEYFEKNLNEEFWRPCEFPLELERFCQILSSYGITVNRNQSLPTSFGQRRAKYFSIHLNG
jgi:hypothetical protein